MSGTDTLRAAVERLCDLADEGSPAERQHSPRWHVATVDLRAALAASPAPTDTPDEPSTDEGLPALVAFFGPCKCPPGECWAEPGESDPRYCGLCSRWCTDGEDRSCPAAVTAPPEDERCGDCGHPRVDHQQGDPDTLAALREAVEAYNEADTMHEVLDAARDLAATATALTTPEQGHTAP